MSLSVHDGCVVGCECGGVQLGNPPYYLFSAHFIITVVVAVVCLGMSSATAGFSFFSSSLFSPLLGRSHTQTSKHKLHINKHKKTERKHERVQQCIDETQQEKVGAENMLFSMGLLYVMA